MKIKIKRSQAMSLNATSALQKAAKKTQTYCPSVHDHEVDTSIHNHTDETFSTNKNINLKSKLNSSRRSHDHLRVNELRIERR